MDESTIGFAAVIGVFGMPALVVLVVMLFIYKQSRDKYHMVETMIKNGLPVPEYIFKSERSEPTPTLNLRNGLIYIAVGIGSAIALFMLDQTEAIGIASIPILVGVAYIIMYYVTREKVCEQGDNDITE